jgi:HAE1 family hydrophobic/amphiphilic exporter-1
MDPGYSYMPVGGAREFQRMLVNFSIALLLSAVFMYLVIAAQFESFVHALVIMMTLPLTMPFAIISVMLFFDSLNLYSLLGMLVLLGVVKKNAILQLDRANQLRGMGMPLVEAAVQASKDRLRPILMTTLAFVAGMAPLTFSSGTGSATNRTAGRIIVGGQALSLLLTLIAAPVFYVVLDSAMTWVRRKLGMKDEGPTGSWGEGDHEAHG